MIHAVAGRAAAATPVGLDALEQFDLLPRLRPDVRTCQDSSHDRDGGNEDSGHFLYSANSENTLVDVKGPGCITRIWITGAVSTSIRFYLDGETTPRVDMALPDFFSGTNPPFTAPLVGNLFASSGGSYCYVPIPFREGCRIATVGSFHYYNVQYQRYPDASGITTFTGQEDMSTALSIWQNTGTDPKADTGAILASQNINLSPGNTATIANLTGPATIQQIEFDIPSLPAGMAAESILEGLKLRITWDDAGTRAVDVPFGEFFGCGLGRATVDALPVGMDGTRLYCYFPMPFAESALVEIHNGGASTVNGIACSLRYSNLPQTPVGVGNFHAKYNAETPTTNGRDYKILNVTGAGHLVGVVQTWHGRESSRSYLEGDERIYVDGQLTPALYGTGSEDFYNGGWYFSQGPFSQPLHGFTAQDPNPPYADTCYRFLVHDFVPFTRSILVGMEHGGTNETPCDLRSVAFYYKTDSPLSVLSDELDVGDTADEVAHNYSVTSPTWSGTSIAAYEGDDPRTLSDTGRRHAGSSQFTVALSPAVNAGVLLRRRMDYTLAKQEAEVYVDGALAGIWYEPGNNTFFAFRDSEFLIPSSLTAGKTSIQIRFDHVSPVSDWTEYRYWVYTLLDAGAADTPSPDFDRDGDVDQIDFAHLQECMTGAGQGQTEPACLDTLLDDDDDVTQSDFAILARCFSGAGVTADLDCDQ